MPALSAVIICFNEERNIERCIRSVQQVSDDIVVVDSGSSDRTLSIAESLGARVFSRAWAGHVAQKNFGNEQAKNDYVLSLDADECLSFELAFHINEAMKAPQVDMYEMSFLTSWGDKFIRRGGWMPDRHLRIFNRKKIKWAGRGIHEFLDAPGCTQERLEGYVFHYTAADKRSYRLKMERYARAFADGRLLLKKYSPFWKKFTSAGFRFVRDYFFKLGFTEGLAGWEIACEEARYTWLKYKWSQKP